MSKTKVVPIDHEFPPRPEAPSIVARDENNTGGVHHRRLIMNIGGQRIAFDFTGRATELKSGTGDQAAPVLPLGDSTAGKPKRPAKRRAPQTAGAVSSS